MGLGRIRRVLAMIGLVLFFAAGPRARAATFSGSRRKLLDSCTSISGIVARSRDIALTSS